MVCATVGGVRTQMMVDTGANTHVITAWLARKAGLDALGGTVERITQDARSRARRSTAHSNRDGKRCAAARAVAEVPDTLEKLGIGGLFRRSSSRPRMASFDLERAEMRTAVKDDLPKIEGRPSERRRALCARTI
jgi:hypothetical protein